MALTRLTLSRLEYDSAADDVVATLPDGTTERVLGGSPGGSDTQAQYNNAGSFAGMSGLVWNASAGKPQLGAGGIQWKNGASIGTMPWNPTAARTLTLPDATDTLVGQATTDPLTNKTLVAASNTITDTGAASGDVLVHNGTRFVKVTAGANGTFLGRSSGVTGFFTPSGGGSTSPGGTSGELQWNSAGSFAGTSNFTYDGTGIVGNASSYVELGTTAPATSGWVRFQAAAANLLAVRDGSNTFNQIVAAHNGSGVLYLGGDIAGANEFTGTVVQASSQVNLNVGVGTIAAATASSFGTTVPRLGYSSPYASEGHVVITSVAGGLTLGPSQYNMAYISFTLGAGASGDAFFPVPADEAHSYMKWINASGNSGATPTIRLVGGGGTTYTPTTTPTLGPPLPFWFTPSGVVLAQ